MNIEAKTKILSICSLYYSGGKDPGWADLIAEWNISFPLAVAVEFGYATLTDEGIAAIEDCYAFTCEAMGVDPKLSFDDYDSWIAASPNGEI